MKKASFFIVLGLAVLLLFGCAGGGGPLGGVSTKPVDTWFVEVLEHYMTSSGKPQYNQSYNEYIKIEVVDNAYHAKAVGEDGVENIEVFELINMVNTIKNKDFKPKILGKNTAYFVSILLLLKNLISKEKLLLTPYSVHTLQTNTLFSHEKAARELGYNPRPLEETVKDTVTWLENNLM
jgi:hypothetical protein